jgi:Flp pilus assembly protein TadG
MGAAPLTTRNNFPADQNGAAAIEFAIVGPVFLLMVIGLIYGCLMLFGIASLHYAVEEGARCASVKTTVCTDSASTVSYTQAAYQGPVMSPTFTSTTAACGHSVTGHANFDFNFAVADLTVPLSATACFP